VVVYKVKILFVKLDVNGIFFPSPFVFYNFNLTGLIKFEI